MAAQRKILPSVSAASVALGLATAIVVLSVVPPTLRPETGLPHGIEHFVIYWGTGLAFALGYELKPALLATRLVFFGCRRNCTVVCTGPPRAPERFHR